MSPTPAVSCRRIVCLQVAESQQPLTIRPPIRVTEPVGMILVSLLGLECLGAPSASWQARPPIHHELGTFSHESTSHVTNIQINPRCLSQFATISNVRPKPFGNG